jgi:Glycosyltransferase family 87
MRDLNISFSKTTLRLLGIAFILLSATHGSPVVAGVTVTVAIVLVLWSIVGGLPLTSGSEIRWAAIAALLLVTGAVGRPIGSLPGSLVEYRPALITLGVLACVAAALWGNRPAGRRGAVVLALSAGILVLAISVGFEWSSTLGSDVYHAHRLAGAALESGDNPYTDAVTFTDGNPFSLSDRAIEGYPYPPVALSIYGLAGAFTDPRLISAVCWLAFLGWLAFGAWRTQNEGSGIKLAVLLLMALAPLGSEVWYMAWTEPLTLSLFLVAALSWNRSHIWSGLLLGLALASKQYLIFLLPLVLLHRDQGWRRRSSTAVAAACLTLIAGMLPNPTAFVRATLGNLTSIGFRPDTQSLPGLANEFGFTFLLPNWLWILLSVAAVAALARSSRTRSDFMLRAGLGLGIAFLFGLAFPNYWFLVAGLLAIGTVLETADVGVRHPGQNEKFPSTQGRRQETRIAGV